MTEVMEEATEEEWDLEDQLWEVGIMAAAVVLEEDLVDGVDMEDEEGLGEGVDSKMIGRAPFLSYSVQQMRGTFWLSMDHGLHR